MQYSLLKPQLDQALETLPAPTATRLHRALSWLQCAEQQRSNVDMQFVSLWICFKACYSLDIDAQQTDLDEKSVIQNFVRQLVGHDQMQKIHHCLWIEFSGSIKKLIRNPFVFKPFWQAQRQQQQGLSEEQIVDWQQAFDQSSVDALNYMSRQRIPELLAIVLDRLYELRNQIIDGGATYRSSINREQVEDGANLLITLMPIVIEIMLINGEENWGDIYYPVVAAE